MRHQKATGVLPHTAKVFYQKTCTMDDCWNFENYPDKYYNKGRLPSLLYLLGLICDEVELHVPFQLMWARCPEFSGAEFMIEGILYFPAHDHS